MSVARPPRRWASRAERARSGRLRAPAELPLFSAFVDDATRATLREAVGDDATLLRDFLPHVRADALLAELRREASWTQERRVMYDRLVDVPREQAWFGDEGAWRRDGADAELDRGDAAAPPGRARPPVVVRPWTALLTPLRDELERLCGATFAYVLVNRYRSGRDGVAWHNDRLVPSRPAPVVASLSLGATRAFDLRPKTRPSEVVSIDLAHGDLFVMRGAFQRRFDHRVRKDPRVADERLNLTFRERPA